MKYNLKYNFIYISGLIDRLNSVTRRGFYYVVDDTSIVLHESNLCNPLTFHSIDGLIFYLENLVSLHA